MAMTINTNVVSINAQRNLSLSGGSLSTTMQRLSSGLRVNSAKDDAAGLAIAERMNAQSKGLAVAARNANDGISLAQTAEGALGKVGDMLQRMRELAVQASNATNSKEDREALQAEVSQLTAEIDRVAKTSSFNGQKLLDGSFAGGVFQVGASAGDNITVGGITNASASKLSSISYAKHTKDLAKGDVGSFDKSVSGLKIMVGTGPAIKLDDLTAASSEGERLGQVVAAINAKTADTGVTAFLTSKEGGAFSVELLSESKDAAGNAKQVTLLGFETATTGLATDTAYDAAAFAGTGGDAGARAAMTAATKGDDLQTILGKVNAKLGAGNQLAAEDIGADWVAAGTTAIGQDKAEAAYDALMSAWAEKAASVAVAAAGTTVGSGWTAEKDTGIAGLDIGTQAGAWKAMQQIDAAIDEVNSARADLGALQTRFEKSIENIDVMNENISAARGRIVDADFATETANLSRAQILQQAGTAMVAQANQLSQGVLSLLQ